MFVWPDVNRFFHGCLDDLRSVLRVADDGVVIHRELLAAHFGFENLRAFLDLVTEANALVFAEKLEHGEQLAIGIRIPLNGVVRAWTEHLLEIRARYPARRNVVAVRFSAELRIQR